MTDAPLERIYLAFGWVALVACTTPVAAAPAEQVTVPLRPDAERVLRLPYAFWNENFGVAAGYVYAVNGYPQPRSAVLGSLMLGENGSITGFAMGHDIGLFGVERLLFDPVLSAGHFGELEAYVDGNPVFPLQRAGSHESDPDNFIRGEGSDMFFRLRFKYLLPIGSGRDAVVPAYQFSDGLLTKGASGATAWSPLRSGRTFVELLPFYRKQSIRTHDIREEQSTNGVEFKAFWDNRDFPGNPSQGNALGLKVARDWGLANSSASWTNVSAEYDHYFPLGPMKGFRQGGVAFDAWTSYSPTWAIQDDGGIAHRPPAFSGATLGGLFRMRAYPSQRFSDKAAVYYGAELRMIPTWNPLDRVAWLQERVGVEWIQLVGFAEAGRVAPRYRFDELHSDLHWDAGFGLRVWAKGLIGRIDVAYSEEGVGMQMMIGHPFQF